MDLTFFDNYIKTAKTDSNFTNISLICYPLAGP